MSLRANLFGALSVAIVDLQSEAMAEAAMLELPDLAALLAIHARPNSNVGEIAAALAMTHSGTVRVVHRLCKARLVERHVGRDRRTAALRCTAGGRELARRALAARRRALRRALQRIRPADRSVIVRVAERMLPQLPRNRHDAWRICRFCEHAVCRGVNCPVGSAIA